MQFIYDLKVKHKLGLMILVPVFYLLYLCAVDIISKQHVVDEAHKILSLGDLAVNISALVHEVQKERGATAGFLGSKGTKFVKKLPAQRKLTDEKIRGLKNFLASFDQTPYGGEFKGFLDKALLDLKKIDSTRGSVNTLDIKHGPALAYYTNMNSAFLHSVSYTSKLSHNPVIARFLNSYVNFLLGKERAGIERAVLSNTFSRDSFEPGMYKKFVSLVTAQNTYMDVFHSFADDKNKAAYKEKMQGEAVNEVNRMRKIAHEKAMEGGFGIDGVYWFDTITKKINLLKDIENHLSEDLAGLIEEELVAAKKAEIMTVLVTALVLLVSFLLSLSLSNIITRPMQRLAKLADDMTEGHVGKKVETKNAKDEIGRLSTAFNLMSQSMKDLIERITTASDHIASASEQISAASVEMANGAEDQTMQAMQVATAVEEMSATVLEVARNSNDASAAANKAVSVAEEGGNVVMETINGMNRIASSFQESAKTVETLGKNSDEIGEIVSVIDDIADQTNLLALNAAIEAARAGEQGRGFAVVADEVRKLAERTTKATKEIALMIKAIQSDTSGAVESITAGTEEVQRGVEYANEAGNALSQIAEVIYSVNGMIQQIATAAEEQSSATEEISLNVETVATISKKTASGARESSEATSSLSELALGLQDSVSKFKIH